MVYGLLLFSFLVFSIYVFSFSCFFEVDRPPIVIQYGRRKTIGMARAPVIEVEEVETALVGTIVSYMGGG